MRRLALIAAIVIAHLVAFWCNARALNWIVQPPEPEPQAAPAMQDADTSSAATSSDAPAADRPSTFEQHMQERELAAQELAAEAASPFSLQLNLDFTTAYFYRGILQEDSGLIMQPAARLTLDLASGDDWGLDLFLSTWNSFHGERTGAASDSDFTDYWYECDLSAGITYTKKQLSFTAAYLLLTSPNDAFGTVEELNFIVGLDDSEWLGAWAMKPYALLAFELGSNASDGRDSGTYLELGVAPGFAFTLGDTEVALSFPASVGLSINDYYQNAEGEDDAFGFAQIGVKAAVPLPFGDRYGAWTLNAGLAAMYLGDHTADINSGDRNEFIATLGLQVNF